MGAQQFFAVRKGKTLRDTFRATVDEAKWEHGHGGYSGTIAEKHEVLEIIVPPGAKPRQYAEWVLYGSSSREVQVTPPADWNGRGWPPGARGSRGSPPVYYRVEQDEPPPEFAAGIARWKKLVDDKWGPAGAVRVDADTWIFIGWASS